MLFMEGDPPEPRWLAAITEIEFGKPLARLVVPSIGSTAISKRSEPPLHVPSLSPRNSPGALSLAPSPITTSPEMSTRSKTPLIASQAAASAFSFSPRPSQGSTFRAAFSVARTNSNSTVRSGSVKMNDSSIIALQANYDCVFRIAAWPCSAPRHESVGGNDHMPSLHHRACFGCTLSPTRQRGGSLVRRAHGLRTPVRIDGTNLRLVQ